MSKIGNYIIEQEETGNDLMAEHENQQVSPIFDRGIWYKCAISGMWSKNYDDYGAVSAVRIDGEEFTRPAHWFIDNDKSFIESVDNPPF